MRLIDAEALNQRVQGWVDTNKEYNLYPEDTPMKVAEVMDLIYTAPTVAERPAAVWEQVQYDANPNISNYHCSNCNFMSTDVTKFKYCPQCGALMGDTQKPTKIGYWSQRRMYTERNQRIVDYYNAGHTMQEAGEEFGLSTQRARDIIRDYQGKERLRKDLGDLYPLYDLFDHRWGNRLQLLDIHNKADLMSWLTSDTGLPIKSWHVTPHRLKSDLERFLNCTIECTGKSKYHFSCDAHPSPSYHFRIKSSSIKDKDD